jgi:hypothetical protein
VIIGALAGAASLARPDDGSRASSGPSGESEFPGLLAESPRDPNSIRRCQAELGGGAQTLDTRHFVLIYDGSATSARKLARRLEAVYSEIARVARELNLPAKPPQHKLEMLIFATYERFQAYQQSLGATDKDILGFYDPQKRRSVFFDLDTHPQVASLRAEIAQLDRSNAQLRAGLARKLRRTAEGLLAKIVQHEAAHQIFDQTGVLGTRDAVPAWLTEGLAQMFELPFLERGATLALSTNRYRLYEFSRLHADDAALLVDLRRILGAGEPAWRGGSDYSLGWALTNYLYKRHREQFAGYLQHLAASPEAGDHQTATPRETFESCFGPLDPDLAADLSAYMRQLLERQSGRLDPG